MKFARLAFALASVLLTTSAKDDLPPPIPPPMELREDQQDADAVGVAPDGYKGDISGKQPPRSPFKKKEQRNWKPNGFDATHAHILGISPQELAPSENEGKILDWHYTMVNDETRNSKYRAAMEKVIDEESVVLDIGTGAGLLALISARAGADKVYTVEFEPPMYNIAQKVIKANGYTNKILSFNNYSSELSVPENLPVKANVLVSEIVDSIIIGEGMIPSYRHALANLVTDDVVMIPYMGTVFLSAIECEDIRKDLVILSGVEKLNFGPLNDWVQVDPTVAPRGTAYSLENSPYQLLSDPTAAVSFDFRNRSMYEQKFPYYRRIELLMTADGILDAVAAWFDLNLDEDIVISTSPLSGWAHERHWTQYVYRFSPIAVQAGDKMTVLIGVHEASIQAEVVLHNDKRPISIDHQQYLAQQQQMEMQRQHNEQQRKAKEEHCAGAGADTEFCKA